MAVAGWAVPEPRRHRTAKQAVPDACYRHIFNHAWMVRAIPGTEAGESGIFPAIDTAST